MEQLILKIKDPNKLSFLLQIIKLLDFVEVEKVKKEKVVSRYDFFKSAGLWAERELHAKDLRNRAWKR